jgi:HD-GYP domain-containing protein (c-di-GMP phosphodiesterase class II)
MRSSLHVNFGNLLLSLSDMMDLVSPHIARHQQRVAYIVWHMAKAAQLDRAHMETVFVAALLHDIGALSPEERIALHAFEESDTHTHAVRGETLLRVSPLVTESAPLVRYHHRDWKTWDRPIDDFMVFGAQCIYCADYIERLIDRHTFILQQNETILAQVHENTPGSFHPDVVALVEQFAHTEEFWLDLVYPRMYSLLMHHGPFRTIDVTLPHIRSISRLFTCVIDFRSRYTSTHSSGVAACAEKMAQLFGYTDYEVLRMRIAGDLHDLGKMAIPNAILEKPGKLTKEEFSVIKSHTYYTYMLLDTIKGFHHIAEIGAFHHERLDGTGYPFHCTAQDMCTNARIMAVADIFTALAEDRPYREGMNDDSIHKILCHHVQNGGLDPGAVDLLCDNYHDIKSYVREKQREASHVYSRMFAGQ